MNGQEVVSGCLKLWPPPEDLTLSEWSELNLFLSPEYSARPGQLKLIPWQREIFDSFTDPAVNEIILMTATQLIKTIFIQACIAYAIAAEPGPVLFGAPKDTDAETFSRERLSPMIRDCPLLAERVLPSKSRDANNTTTFKRFPGGSISLVGTIAPGNLARRTIRYFFGDEIDKWEKSAGVEGDPITLGRARTLWYKSRRKIVLACSPTLKGASRISRAYDTSDQRKPYVPCPKCGFEQILTFTPGVVWEGRDTESVRYQCANCRAKWTDAERLEAVEMARWKRHGPFAGVAGFWINHLYSENVSLADLVFGPEGFLVQKENKQTLVSFVNTRLAELWQDEGERPEHEGIFARRERYPFGRETGVVPDRAVFLTAGVDVQEFRLEAEVVAWAPGRENWSIDYLVIEAFDGKDKPIRTSSVEPWIILEQALAGTYKHASGATMPILAVSIDVGHNARSVYEFARRHPRPSFGPKGMLVVSPRTVLCVQGLDKENLVPILKFSNTESASKRGGIRVVKLGTGYLKQQLYDMLRVRAHGDKPTPGCCHFPDYSEDYFKGLVAETRVVSDTGVVSYRKDYPRNEPLDCRVYASAAAVACGIERMQEHHWDALRKTLIGSVQPTPAETPVVAEEQPAPQRASWFGDRSSWFSR